LTRRWQKVKRASSTLVMSEEEKKRLGHHIGLNSRKRVQVLLNSNTEVCLFQQELPKKYLDLLNFVINSPQILVMGIISELSTGHSMLDMCRAAIHSFTVREERTEI
jgi:hypothetical protein